MVSLFSKCWICSFCYSFEEEAEQVAQDTQNVPNINIIKNEVTNNKIEDKIGINSTNATINKNEQNQIDAEPITEENEELDPDMPKFDTPKERECWVMYKKMVDKGLPVTYDTLLRGLLTPSEYRMTRKEVQQPPTP